MATLFEQQGGQYELQGDYRLPCVTLPNENEYEIGVWGERHRRYLKEHHKVRYYNLLTAGTLDVYLADIESQAQEIFEQTVKSLAEKENVTEKLKVTLPMDWVQKMNNIRNRATEIVNTEVIFV